MSLEVNQNGVSMIGHTLSRRTMQLWLGEKIRDAMRDGCSKDEAIRYIAELLEEYTLCPMCANWIERSWKHEDWCPSCVLAGDIIDEIPESPELFEDEDIEAFVGEVLPVVKPNGKST